tara:strand:- start:436 stop:3255 length:2820 start_codon:yes stop_codon:yes gene_type:complete
MNTKIYNLFKTLAFSALVLTFFVPSTLIAAEDDEADVEEVVVTGSRIKRDTINSAAVVTTITAEDIEQSQALTTADALRLSTYNTFGSYPSTAGNSAMSNTTISLRGLGGSRTLVLMDGRRMPGSPHLGGAGSANINMIPTVAVDRIEILADGASSVYGSDAIAGVVNVITKKGFDGMDISVRSGDRSRDDGVENAISMIFGSTNEKGYITVALEHDERDEIYLKDRWYTAARANDENGDGVIDLYFETYGLSWYSRNLADPVTGNIAAAPTCEGNIDGSTTPWWGPNFGGAAFGQGPTTTGSYPGAQPRGICGYAWADIMVQDAGLFRDTFTTNVEHAINDRITFYSRATFVRNESVGRYAPPAARYPGILPSDPANPYDVAVTGYWRWTEIGNRGMHFVDQSSDWVGELAFDVSDNVEITFSHQVNKFYGTDIGRYYLDYAGLASNLYYETPFGSEDGLYALSATTVVEYDNHYEKTDLVAQISDLMELPGGPVDMVLGYEGFDNRYSAQYDKHSEGGYVGGSAGNSGAGDRGVDAFFGEILFPVMANLEITASFRSDDYDDVGSNDSIKVGVLWEGDRGTSLKLNFGEGFRAPTMDTLYGVTTFSANTATDYLACANAGVSQSACASKQVSTLITSNPELGAETSEATVFSIAQDMGELTPVLENLIVRLDWYNISMENLISSVSTQDVLYSDFTNGNLLTGNYEYYDAAGLKGDGSAAGAPVGTGTSSTCPSNATYYKRLGVSPALYTIRSCANGRIDYVGASYANQGEYEVEGYDLQVNYTVELGGGDLDIDLDYTHVEDYGGAPFIGSNAHQNNAGFNGLPDTRYNLGLTYTWGAYGVSVQNRHIGDFAFNSNCVSQEEGGLCTKAGPYQDKYDTIDIQARGDFGKYGTVSIGVINASDKDPLPDKGGVNYDSYTSLYDNRGKVTYVRWKLSL